MAPNAIILDHFTEWTGRHLLLLLFMACGCVTRDPCSDCTPPGRPNLRCTILDTESCKKRSNSIYNSEPGHYPDSPRNLKVETYMKHYDGDGKSYPVVNISFNGPDVGFTFLKGFEITLTIMTEGHARDFPICRLFDLSRATFSPEDAMAFPQLVFSYSGCLTRLRSYTSYEVRVRSLPEPTSITLPAKDVFVNIYTPGPLEPVADINNTADYAFYITATVNNGQVRVEFSRPPKEYKFMKFRVSLIRYKKNEEGGEIPKLVLSQEVYANNVVFEALCSGLYGVWVEPVDLYLFERNKCQCRLNGECDICLITKTSSPINVTTGGPSCPGNDLPSTTDPGRGPVDEPTGQGAPKLDIVLGTIIPVGLIIPILGVVVVYWKRRARGGSIPLMKPEDRSQEPDPSTSNPGLGLSHLGPPQATDFTDEWKSVFLLYYPDNPSHKSAVSLFADFLEYDCFMKVILYDRCLNDISKQGKECWVFQKMETVDWIIMVNSEGAYEEFKRCMTSAQSTESLTGDMFACAMKILDRYSYIMSKKCISVYFPYTHHGRLIRQFTPEGIHYELMTNMELIFLRVHGKEKYQRDCVLGCFVACDKKYHRTYRGQKLKELIDVMIGYTSLPIESVEPCDDNQQNQDSGFQSGLKFPSFGSLANVDIRCFDQESDENDPETYQRYHRTDPDASSCESIGSAARAEFEDFYRECPPDGLVFLPTFRQDVQHVHLNGYGDENYGDFIYSVTV